MKYLKVVGPGTKREGDYAILEGERVSLIAAGWGESPVQRTGVVFPLSAVERFLPPVEPPNIIALGLNYREHAAESRMELPAAPVIFLKATSALTGHQQPIVLPQEAPGEVDYEAELVIVIGKRAKNVSEEKAFDYIFGYTCGNDVSARDCQWRLDKQWARAKSFDTFCPVGPFVETKIETSNLKIQTRLNGKIMQDDTTANMLFGVPQIISYLSRQITLLPGTLIMTGTPPGVGFARRPPVFLRKGDIVEVEIEGLGVLSNPVVAEKTGTCRKYQKKVK